MKIHYFPDSDMLYIELKARPGADAREIADGVVIDLDEEENVIGFEIDHASKRLDTTAVDVVIES